MLKKILCMLLAGLMLTSTVACASSDTEDDTAANRGTAAVTEEDNTEIRPELPEVTYDGEPFRILTEEGY
jgi:hypothetical protein